MRSRKATIAGRTLRQDKICDKSARSRPASGCCSMLRSSLLCKGLTKTNAEERHGRSRRPAIRCGRAGGERPRLVASGPVRRARDQTLRRAALDSRQYHPSQRHRLGSRPHAYHRPLLWAERGAGHGGVAQAGEAARRHRSGFRRAGAQARGGSERGGAEGRENCGPRQLLHRGRLLGPGDVDDRRGQSAAQNAQQQETRDFRQIHEFLPIITSNGSKSPIAANRCRRSSTCRRIIEAAPRSRPSSRSPAWTASRSVRSPLHRTPG